MDGRHQVTDPVETESLRSELPSFATDSVERICLFVGYPRSGHSLVGAILDAHPQAVVAHELDLLAYWERGREWPELSARIQQNSRDSAARARTQSGYSYPLPGLGVSERPLVLGDKKGGRTAHYLTLQPDILNRFQEDTPWPIHLVHVIRDPRDNVATMSRLHKLSPSDALSSYRIRAEAIVSLKQSWPPERFYDIYLESLIGHCDTELRSLCLYLGLAPDEAHMQAASDLLFKNPRETRSGLVLEDCAQILSMCEDIEHLRHYL